MMTFIQKIGYEAYWNGFNFDECPFTGHNRQEWEKGWVLCQLEIGDFTNV